MVLWFISNKTGLQQGPVGMSGVHESRVSVPPVNGIIISGDKITYIITTAGQLKRLKAASLNPYIVTLKVVRPDKPLQHQTPMLIPGKKVAG